MCGTVLITGKSTTVQFQYLERKEGKTKEKGVAGYEASICFIA
jgi:hypothetical protein